MSHFWVPGRLLLAATVVAAFLTGMLVQRAFAAPRRAQDIPVVESSTANRTPGLTEAPRSPSVGARGRVRPLSAGFSLAFRGARGASPTNSPVPRTLSGIASWGDGWSGVVTRLKRGTPITVCGPLGCWSGRSVGYGPAKWTGRIADLSAAVFRAICGPLSAGLCRVTLRW